MLGFFACSLKRVTDGYRAMGPLELYEKLTEQGDQVRALKTAKASKVSVNGMSFVVRKIEQYENNNIKASISDHFVNITIVYNY